MTPTGDSRLTTPDPIPDPVNHPPHYQTAAGIEAIDVIEAQCGVAGHLPTAIKYILRHRTKGHPAQDLRKASWYVRRVLACPLLPVSGPSLGRDYADRVADAFGLVGLAREALGHLLTGASVPGRGLARAVDAARVDYRRRLTLAEAVAALDLAAEAIEAGEVAV